jgi:hypothetical protein
MLTEVLNNNKLETKLYYNANKRLSKVEQYDGTGKVEFYEIYEYKKDTVLHKKKYGDETGLTGDYTKYTADTKGRIVSAKFIETTGYVTDISYEYGVFTMSDRVIRRTVNFPESGSLMITEYSYQNGVLAGEKEYKQPLAGGNKKLMKEVAYSPVTDAVQKTIYENHQKAFTEPGSDRFINQLAGQGYVEKRYSNDGILEVHIDAGFSSRIINSKGNVTFQKSTLNFLLPAIPASIINYKYSYTEQ